MLIATLGSCVKGDKGDTGATGAAGTNGTNGNANVVAGFVTLNSSNYTWDNTAKLYYSDVTDASITSDIVSTGVVLCFLQASGQSAWTAMPSSIALSSTESIYFTFSYYLNTVELDLQFSDQSTASSIGTTNFKIVCISSAQRQAHPHTNWNNYNEVQAALGSSMIEHTL